MSKKNVKPQTKAKRNTFDQDEALETEFSWAHLKRSVVYAKKYTKSLLLALVFSVLITIAEMLIPQLLMQIIDKHVPAKNVSAILWTGLIGAGLVLLIALCSHNKQMTCARTGQSIVSEIRTDLFKHLQTLPFDYFDSRPHGKIMVRVVNYINSVADFFASHAVNMVSHVLSLLIIPFFMFTTDVKLSLVSLVCVVPYAAFMWTTGAVYRKRQRIFSNKNSNINAYYQESINGMRITQSFAREEANHETSARMAEDYSKAFMHAKYIQHLRGPVSALLNAFSVAAIYYIGITSGNYSVGIVIAMATYTSRFWQPITNLGTLYNVFQDAAAYLERIFEVMDTPSAIHDTPGATELPPIEGHVQFKDVHFEYEENRPILEHLSFKVKAGESIALVGPTGAGKTTVVNLLSRFYDIKSGEITIDGHDIHGVTLNSLRTQMGVMLQDTFIFTGTIADNIRYGKLDATDEEIIQAAKTVCAHDFIMNLPKGYDTVVSERGASLSAGQRQLISFARTLLSDPKILILDEATSAMDTKTELLVQKGLAQLLKNRTSFIIAHRLSTIKNCDRILYIADRNIAEAGSHDQLLAARGLYYELYTSQLD